MSQANIYYEIFDMSTIICKIHYGNNLKQKPTTALSINQSSVPNLANSRFPPIVALPRQQCFAVWGISNIKVYD